MNRQQEEAERAFSSKLVITCNILHLRLHCSTYYYVASQPVSLSASSIDYFFPFLYTTTTAILSNISDRVTQQYSSTIENQTPEKLLFFFFLSFLVVCSKMLYIENC